MTGDNNRFKTHEQLWKLEDGELSTPLHDELVLQLLNPKNAIKFLNIIGYNESLWKYEYKGEINYYDINWDKLHPDFSDLQFKSEELTMLYKKAEKSMDDDAKSMFEKVVKSVIEDFPSIKSEVPIQINSNKFIIGYIDVSICMPINCEAAAKSELFMYSNKNGKICRRLGRSLRVYNDSYVNQEQILLHIEVKPIIKSFGETLRQINTYRACKDNAIYCIYSPDTRFKLAFENQGMKFVTPLDLGLK